MDESKALADASYKQLQEAKDAPKGLEGESLVRVVYAEALAHAGDHDAARAAIQEAEARLRVRASWLLDPALRESFLVRVPENARTLELARLWLV